MGVDNWNDKGEPWSDRGVEWAAETLASGLQGIPIIFPSLGAPDCAMLAQEFRILTGTGPITVCPSGRAP